MLENERVRAAQRLRAATDEFRNGRFDRALETIESGESSDGLSPAAKSLRSDILFRLGRDDDSLASACEAFEAKPSRPDFALRLAERLIEADRMDEAVRVLERACAFPASIERILAGVAALPLEPHTVRRFYEAAFAPMYLDTPERSDEDCEASILQTLRQHTASWQGRRHRPGSVIVSRNEAGRLPPLFWCFQSELEFARLAAALGPEQPVFGMRSGHLIIGYRPSELDAMTRIYAREMMEIVPSGAFHLGGNCQGGIIVHRAALALREAGRSVYALILMEQLLFPPYDGPVSFVFGRESTLNPHRRMPDPERFFAETYGADASFEIIDGAHGEFFTGTNLQSLAECVRVCLSRASAGEPAR